MTNSRSQKRNFTIPQFVEAHNISRSTLYNEIKSGRLRIMKVGTKTLISDEAAANWQEQVQRDTPAAA